MSETKTLLGNSVESPSEEVESEAQSWLVRRRPLVTLLSLMAGNFLCASIVSLQAPFFPQQAESKGATPTQYGLIFGIYQLVFFLTAPVIGKLVAFIEPKLLLCLGIFVLGFCCVLFGLLTFSPVGTPFLAMAFTIRIVEGVGSAAYATTAFTIVAAEFPKKVGTTFATVGACFGVGLISGPTIGGALFEVGGFNLPFSVMGSLMVVYAFVSYCFLPYIAPDKKDSSLGLKDTFKFWFHFKSLVPALCIVTNFFIIGFNAAVLEPHIRQFGLSPFLVGLMFVISGGIYGMTAPLWGFIADRWVSPKVLCFLGSIFSTVFCLFIGPAPFFPFDTKLWMVIVSLVFFGLGSGSQFVCAFVALSKDTKKRGYPDSLSTSGLVSSVIATSQSLGNFVGPSLGGFLFDNFGYRNATLMLLALELFVVVVTGAFVLQERRENVRETKLSEESSRLIQPSV